MSRTWWQRDLEAHRQRDGKCPKCKTPRRCWPWAEAFAESLRAQMGER